MRGTCSCRWSAERCWRSRHGDEAPGRRAGGSATGDTTEQLARHRGAPPCSTPNMRYVSAPSLDRTRPVCTRPVQVPATEGIWSTRRTNSQEHCSHHLASGARPFIWTYKHTTHTHIYIHMYVCVCIMYLHTYMFIYKYVCKYICIYMCVTHTYFIELS